MTIRNISVVISFSGMLFLSGCIGISPAPVEERGEPPPANPYAVHGGEAVATPYKRRGGGAPAQSQIQSQSQGGEAVVSLLDDADKQAQGGRLDSSAASIERALRIQPKNPSLWLQLARIRMQQGKLQQAEGLAAKSMTLSLNNPQLRIENWRPVAQIRQKAGNASGAAAAMERANTLESAN